MRVCGGRVHGGGGADAAPIPTQHAFRPSLCREGGGKEGRQEGGSVAFLESKRTHIV